MGGRVVWCVRQVCFRGQASWKSRAARKQYPTGRGQANNSSSLASQRDLELAHDRKALTSSEICNSSSPRCCLHCFAQSCVMMPMMMMLDKTAIHPLKTRPAQW